MAKILHLEKSFHFHPDSKSHIVLLDGKYMPTLEMFYTEISKALEFPDYFAHNLDSFEEMINDLEWIQAEHILILISRSHLWLKPDDESKQEILDIIENAEKPGLELWMF